MQSLPHCGRTVLNTLWQCSLYHTVAEQSIIHWQCSLYHIVAEQSLIHCGSAVFTTLWQSRLYHTVAEQSLPHSGRTVFNTLRQASRTALDQGITHSHPNHMVEGKANASCDEEIWMFPTQPKLPDTIIWLPHKITLNCGIVYQRK